MRERGTRMTLTLSIRAYTDGTGFHGFFVFAFAKTGVNSTALFINYHLTMSHFGRQTKDLPSPIRARMCVAQQAGPCEIPYWSFKISANPLHPFHPCSPY